MRPSAQPFLWKWVLFAWQWKMISISKAENLPSFWNRGAGEHSFTHIEHRARAFARERVGWTKSQSSLLNSYFRLSGFLSSLQIIHFRYGPNVSTKVWQRTYPMCDAPRSKSSLRDRNRAEIPVLMCEQKPYPEWFPCRSKSYPV